jgi:hypothetical protein
MRINREILSIRERHKSAAVLSSILALAGSAAVSGCEMPQDHDNETPVGIELLEQESGPIPQEPTGYYDSNIVP